MNVTLVGGNWDGKDGKKSGVVEILECQFLLSFLLTICEREGSRLQSWDESERRNKY